MIEPGRNTLTVLVSTAHDPDREDEARLTAIRTGLRRTGIEIVTLDAGTVDDWPQVQARLQDCTTTFAAFIAGDVTPLPGTIAALLERVMDDEELPGSSARMVGVGRAQPGAACTWPDRTGSACSHTPSPLCWLARRDDAVLAVSRLSAGGTGSDPLARFEVHPQALAFTTRPIPVATVDRRPPRALVLDACTPTPDRDSGSADAFHYMRLLRQLGWDVTFAPVDNLAWFGRYTQALEALGITCLDRPRVARLDTWLETHGAALDLVMLWRVQTARDYLEAVRAYCPRARTVFVTVDLHFVRLEREARLSGDPAAIPLAREVARQEFAAVDAVDLTIAISDVEAALLRERRPGALVHTMPIVRPVPGRRKGYAARCHIAFIGGYGHPPNVDAVHHFVEAIWPAVHARLPWVSFLIVGANAPESFSRLSMEGVIYRGHVPDLADVLDSVRLTVAPLRYGAGQKGKVVSSLGYGVPVVLTAMAAEGMGIVDGEHALVRDDPAGFAQAVVQLYEDEATWTRLSDAGMQLAREAFGLERGRTALTAALDAVGLGAATPHPAEL